ncbi:hypothetical protein FJW06_29425 [Mesorhizobium sp. B4-1-3]|uniref:hypothetical protein n=1 Tax=Mesorhizobium sp. B4-1-3 TaxID=2589889 RepID=UPI00112BF35C|nr:hypothetical protein [Mesorhizobium sp. B4-1-3]TPI07950.1 hypothetical protein FJW06_29425 [Mesorhizobium sp. B4-1-3]
MKRTIKLGDTPEAWQAEALLAKAQRYAEKMLGQDSDDWDYALWSSLLLELLARAALSNVSPALLAETDNRTWNSLYHSLGFQPKEQRYVPRSIAIAEVMRRLGSILPDLNQELEDFGVLHTGRRNAELHSGEAAFEGLPGSSWQPKFFSVCKVLLESMGHTLGDLFGEEQAKAAEKMVAAAADDSAKAVRGDIEAHKKVWQAKEDADREKLAAQATLWATRRAGHAVACPACQSNALVIGEPVSPPNKKLEGETIVSTQEFLPSQFECIACGLKITGLSRLNAAGVGDKYKQTITYSASDYYGVAPEEEDDGRYFEDDNNEPF